MSCVCHAFASVHCCLVVTWRERADLLALVCDVIVILLLSHLVSWDRCGTWVYRFLFFGVFLTFTMKGLKTWHLAFIIKTLKYFTNTHSKSNYCIHVIRHSIICKYSTLHRKQTACKESKVNHSNIKMPACELLYMWGSKWAELSYCQIR